MIIKKQYSDKVKAKVIAEALEGKKSYKQIGDENGGIHPTTIVRWVKEWKREYPQDPVSTQDELPNQEQASNQADWEQERLALQVEWEKERQKLLTEIWMVTTERDHWKDIVREIRR